MAAEPGATTQTRLSELVIPVPVGSISLSLLPQSDALHPLYIIIAIIDHGIWDFTGVERAFQPDYRIFDAALRNEAEFLLYARRRNVIRAVIVGRGNDDFHLVADFFTHHLGDFHDLEIMIARVPGLAVHGAVGRFQQFQIQIRHIVDVEIRAAIARRRTP